MPNNDHIIFDWSAFYKFMLESEEFRNTLPKSEKLRIVRRVKKQSVSQVSVTVDSNSKLTTEAESG